MPRRKLNKHKIDLALVVWNSTNLEEDKISKSLKLTNENSACSALFKTGGCWSDHDRIQTGNGCLKFRSSMSHQRPPMLIDSTADWFLYRLTAD